MSSLEYQEFLAELGVVPPVSDDDHCLSLGSREEKGSSLDLDGPSPRPCGGLYANQKIRV